MKKVLLAVSLLFGGAALVNAQDREQQTTPAQTAPAPGQEQDQDGQEIAIAELPEGIKASLESQDYSGWTIGKAFKKTDATKNNMEMYVVELKNGTETKKVKFDKDGTKLQDDEEKDDLK